MKILGLSFFYHDAAACLLIDGVPVAMSEEERFTRKKHDSDFPEEAINFVLAEGGITAADLDAVVFYEKPMVKLDRIFETALKTFPWAPGSFVEAIKHLFIDKLWVRQLITSRLHVSSAKVLFSDHHLSHAASAFYSSGFEEAAILTVDGVGEWATLSLSHGKRDGRIEILKTINFPHSLGLLYSAFTAFLGFEVNEGEYKVMGMAPYGTQRYAAEVRKLIKTFPDGSFELDMSYFSFDRSLNETYSAKFRNLFGRPRNRKSKFFTRSTGWPTYFGPKPGPGVYEQMAKVQEHYADIAASIQLVTEERFVALAKHLHSITKLNNLCLAGGVALNSVANSKIRSGTPFKHLFVQPASGDGGGALGAALAYYHSQGKPRSFVMKHAYFGKEYSENEIREVLERRQINFKNFLDEGSLVERVAGLIADGKVIGWFQGRAEWGPRALGNRSIIADPRSHKMKDIVNTKIKFREPYRPFAPSILAESAEEFFDLPQAMTESPARFMLYVVQVRNSKREVVPAITHVDGSARPQLVFKEESPRYYKLIEAFKNKTGVPLLMNTSFNLRGEPIVNSPDDALNTFFKSEMDACVLGNFLILKDEN